MVTEQITHGSWFEQELQPATTSPPGAQCWYLPLRRRACFRMHKYSQSTLSCRGAGGHRRTGHGVQRGLLVASDRARVRGFSSALLPRHRASGVALFNLGICWGAPPRIPWTLPGNQLGSASILAMSLPMASSVGRAFRRLSFVTASTNPLIQVFRP